MLIHSSVAYFLSAILRLLSFERALRIRLHGAIFFCFFDRCNLTVAALLVYSCRQDLALVLVDLIIVLRVLNFFIVKNSIRTQLFFLLHI